MTFLVKTRIPRNKLMMAAGVLVILCSLLASIDIFHAVQKANALYAVGIQELSLQGDLQYYTQEGRRNFLYALSTDDPNEQLPWVNQARMADQKIQSLVQSSLDLDLDATTRQGVITLDQNWKYYSKVRDNIIALILEGQPKEAVALDSTTGALAFKVVSDTIWTLKKSLDSYASRQSAELRTLCCGREWPR